MNLGRSLMYIKKAGVPKRNPVVPVTVSHENRLEFRSKLQAVFYSPGNF